MFKLDLFRDALDITVYHRKETDLANHFQILDEWKNWEILPRRIYGPLGPHFSVVNLSKKSVAGPTHVFTNINTCVWNSTVHINCWTVKMDKRLHYIYINHSFFCNDIYFSRHFILKKKLDLHLQTKKLSKFFRSFLCLKNKVSAKIYINTKNMSDSLSFFFFYM